MNKTVVKDHEATYSDPIAVEAGDVISLSGKSDNWDGHKWLWAESRDGKAGWVPDSLVRSSDGVSCAVRRYSAAELTCRSGDILLVIEETHGWAWCRSTEGKQGWVPLRNLSAPETGRAGNVEGPDKL